jgi:hypothetical protein
MFKALDTQGWDYDSLEFKAKRLHHSSPCPL